MFGGEACFPNPSPSWFAGAVDLEQHDNWPDQLPCHRPPAWAAARGGGVDTHLGLSVPHRDNRLQMLVALGSDLCHIRPAGGRASIAGVPGRCSMAVCRKGEGALR